MKNNIQGNRQQAHNFQRGGDVLAGSRVDDDILIGAPESARHLLTHYVRGTARLGEILPTDLIHVLPKDDYKVDMTHTCQFKPMPKPTFDNIVTKMHSFGVKYKDIYGDYFPLFKTGGKLGIAKRELPYYDMRGKVYNGSGVNVTPQYILSIALIAWCFSHKVSFKDAFNFIRTTDSSSNTVWDVDHLLLVFDSAFGKGSLLDMFNLGVGHIDRAALEGKSILPQTIDLDYPSMIPLAPLVAFQRICNDYFRVEDYSYDMFYEYENINEKLYRMTLPSSQRIDVDDIFDYMNYDVQLPYGTIIRNLDKIYLPEDNAIRDIIVSKSEMHFKLGFESYSYVKSGSEVEVTALLDLNNTVISFSPSMVMLGWLLSKSSVPMEKDYPTMILPRTQRGIVESVTAIGGASTSTVPVTIPVPDGSNQPQLVISGSDGHKYSFKNLPWNSSGTATGALVLDSRTDYAYVELPGGSSGNLDMNTLRWINAVTKLAEKENLVGPDYAKQLLAEYGVEPEWAMVDRIQYLGGLVCNPRVEKVTSTSDTYDPSKTIGNGMVLGDYSGDASQYSEGHFTYHSDDFGMIITVMSTVPQASYSRFIDRNSFKVFDITTWFNKSFEDLTEQHLYAEEFSGNDTHRLARLISGNEDSLGSSVLGYVPRMQEYRQMLNTVHGEMIPSLGTIDESSWTASRDFNGVNSLTEKDLLYSSVDSPENSRLFMFNIVDFPPMDFTCSFGVSAVRRVGKITLPITL